MDVTERFGDRVDEYDRYRPGYPDSLGRWLAEHGMQPGAKVADVGAGTGIFAELLVGLGCEVALVEPNQPMLDRARARLGDRPGVSFVSGRAEATSLDDGSMDWATAAQAFHWFDPAPTRREMRRILRPPPRVVLVWNDRRAGTDPLMTDYESLLREWGTDYDQTSYRMRSAESRMREFFDGDFEQATFDNAQTLDQAGLIGRFFSSSFMPGRDDPRHDSARRAGSELFERHAQSGRVTLRYDTIAYLGRV